MVPMPVVVPVGGVRGTECGAGGGAVGLGPTGPGSFGCSPGFFGGGPNLGRFIQSEQALQWLQLSPFGQLLVHLKTKLSLGPGTQGSSPARGGGGPIPSGGDLNLQGFGVVRYPL